jgi:hypothetical protein
VVLPPVQNALSPAPVKTAATTLRSLDAAVNAAMTPFTMRVV